MKRLTRYVGEKTAEGMLDLFYLNQTRQHLAEIAKTVENQNIPDAEKMPLLEEMSFGLDVCKEGVAMNIMECASQCHLKSLPNKLHAAYQQAREELINTYLLMAVRASHAEEWSPEENAKDIGPGKAPAGSLGDYKESASKTFKSLEIHEVQSLRNALSKELGLDYLADRHISMNYQEVVGQIARDKIPQLITTHNVAKLVAEKVVQRAKQLLEENSSGEKLASPDKILDAYGAMSSTLMEEFGPEAKAVFEYDTTINSIVLLNADDLAEAWSASPTLLPQEKSTIKVEQQHVRQMVTAFFQADRLVISSPRPSNTRAYLASGGDHFLGSIHASIHQQNDDEKKKALRRMQLAQDSLARANQHLSEPGANDAASTAQNAQLAQNGRVT
ncbi:MAG TPA: hypothetical protein VFV28_03820 [Limnobacter sp.]|nr:hypothetical protein [Limnobacter sp.]